MSRRVPQQTPPSRIAWAGSVHAQPGIPAKAAGAACVLAWRYSHCWLVPTPPDPDARSFDLIRAANQPLKSLTWIRFEIIIARHMQSGARHGTRDDNFKPDPG